MQKIAGFITLVHAVIERLRETGEKPGLKVKTGDALTDWTISSAKAEPVTQLHETCINTGTAVQLDSDAHTRSQKLTCFCVDDFHCD